MASTAQATETGQPVLRPPPLTGSEYDGAKNPLDPNMYDVDVGFFSAVTGITDEEELKAHVLKAQAEAYAVHAYPCIRAFAFAHTKIDRFPVYRDILTLGKERKGALFLDLGCGVGNDLRKVILDGFPSSQVIGSDLHPDFWEIGHTLFRSTPESFPTKFVPGDVFDPTFLEPRHIVTSVPDGPQPDLESLTTLTPLVGRVSVIHTSAFFHLFNEERQEELARLVGSLLSPEPGSIICGAHAGQPQKGLRSEAWQAGQKSEDIRLFCHSPESWKELWEKIFGVGKVEVSAMLKEIERRDLEKGEDVKVYFLVWSVKRL
ncbi:hypothetical protein BDW22DRAFT_1128383 [Trametopsis cervina]|nr:hypothetical protein BDW22DRAFT_1128383 [Trametopsis cervina]